MSTPQVIAISLFLSGLIGWIVSFEIRLRKANAKLLIAEQKVADGNIVAQIHNLTDAALKLTLESDLGSGPDAGSGSNQAADPVHDVSKPGAS